MIFLKHNNELRINKAGVLKGVITFVERKNHLKMIVSRDTVIWKPTKSDVLRKKW